MQLIFVLAAVFLQSLSALTCLSGTYGNLTTCVANTAVGQQCITAIITSTVLQPTPTTPKVGYFCGIPAEARNLYLRGLYNCTSSDNCTSIPPGPVQPRCVYPDAASCTANYEENCAWCAGSAFAGQSFCFYAPLPCQFYYSAPSGLIQTPLPFSAFTPNRVCSGVLCPIVPPYTVNFYTKQYLITDLGLPGVFPGNSSQQGFLALDLFPRDLYILNTTESRTFCHAQDMLTNWCGVNMTTAYRYCVVTETYPQYDAVGWFANSTLITAGFIWPSFPAICACNKPGRAVYIPYNPIVGYNYYENVCQKESVMLAFYIVLMVIVAILIILVFIDMIRSFLVGKESKKGNLCQQILKHHTLKVKLAILMYFLLCLVSMIVFIQPKKIGSLLIASYVLSLLRIIFLLFAYNMTAFTFGQLVLKSQIFGKNGTAIVVLKIYNWFFVLFISACLIGCIVLLGLFGNLVALTSDPISIFNISNYRNAVVVTYAITKGGFVLLASTETIMLFVTFVWFIYCTYVIMTRGRSRKGGKNMRTLLVRNVLLLVSIPFALINLGIFWYITYFYGWVRTQSVPAIVGTAYDDFTVNVWIFWAEYVSEIIWMALIAYAMRAAVKNSYLFKLLKDYVTATSRSEMSGGAMDSKKSGMSVTGE